MNARVSNGYPFHPYILAVPTEESNSPCPELTLADDPSTPAAPPVPEETQEAAAPALDADQPSDENLWSRSRDFDWGD